MKTDIQIAQETPMLHINEIAKKVGLSEDDIEQYGKYKAKVNLEVLKRHADKPNGKLILVTAITPTPAGEGKSTVTIGLTQALNKRSEEHTSELQSRQYLVCRLLLEKKKKKIH